jgi:hypothetical protein
MVRTAIVPEPWVKTHGYCLRCRYATSDSALA